MKTAWNVVSFLAVVHLLALLMFAGWLWQTDRLDGGRIDEVRALFAPTISESRAVLVQADLEAEAALQQRAETARRQRPPLPAAYRVDRLADDQQDQARAEHHLDLVRRQLLQQFDIVALQLETERDALNADRQGFEQGVDADQQQRYAAQLTKAVKLLESLPPKQAKQKIIELVQSGRSDQAVVYLDAMNQRSAGKVLAEFKTAEDNILATELLERIRTLGLRKSETGAPRDSSDADRLANAR
ncbi:MAG: hypothetical protein ACYSU7_10525 [Planctomycetota bacterium]|jgi:hypothetical protein